MPGDPVLLGQLTVRVMAGAGLFFALWFLTIPISLILFGAILIDMLVVATSGRPLSLTMLIANHLHLYLFQAIFIGYILGGAGSYSIDWRLFSPSDNTDSPEPQHSELSEKNNNLVTANIPIPEQIFQEPENKIEETIVSTETQRPSEKATEEIFEELPQSSKEEEFKPKIEEKSIDFSAPTGDLFKTTAPVQEPIQENFTEELSEIKNPEEMKPIETFSEPISMEEIEKQSLPENEKSEEIEPIKTPEIQQEEATKSEETIAPVAKEQTQTPISQPENDFFVSDAARKIMEENEKIQKKIQEQNQLIKQWSEKLDTFLAQSSQKSEEKIIIEKPLLLTKTPSQKTTIASPAPDHKKHFKSDISKPWISKSSSPHKFTLKKPEKVNYTEPLLKS